MKTKSLMTAGALAMLMAACSNEELVQNEQLISERPLAGDVVIKTNIAGDEESRAVWTGLGYSFEAGDRFGTYLMDTWNGGKSYTLVDYIHTNYPFVAEKNGDGLVWKSVSGAPLCEGNYFFAWPYNPAYTNRGYITYSVNPLQSICTEDGSVEPFGALKENQKYLGYAFVEATSGDVNELDLDLLPVFATPRFKVQNMTTADLKVKKMIIRAHENGQIQQLPTTVALAPATGKFNGAGYADLETKLQISALQNALVVDKKGNQTYEYVIDCGDNYVVGTEEYIQIAAVMPGGNYGQLDIFFFAESAKTGKSYIIRLNDTNKTNWDGQSQSGSMQTVMKPGITQRYTAEIYTESLASIGIEGFTVVTSEDLKYVIDMKAKDGGREAVKITTWGENVVLTKEVYDLISAENRAGIEWAIDGAIVIPEDAAANTIDMLTTGILGANTTIINYGAQTLTKNVEADIVNYGTIAGNVTINGKVTNNEGAEMNVAIIIGDVDNKGKIEAGLITGVLNNGKWDSERNNGKPGVTTATAVVEKVKTIRNWGYAKVNTVDRVSGGANGAYSNKSGGVLELMGGLVSPGQNMDGGKIIVTGNSVLYGKNGGEMVVNAELTTIGFANAGEITVSENGTLKSDDKVLNYGILNVAGKAVEGIYNSGVINVIENGWVIVTDIVDVDTEFELYDNNVTSTYYGAVGTIDVTKANGESGSQAAKSNSEDMIFTYTVNSATTAAEIESALKTRISSKNYGVNEVHLTWGAESAQKVSGYFDNANVKGVLIENTLLVEGNTRFASVEGITIDRTGVLTVDNDVVLRVADNCAVTVNGVLKANNQSWLKGDNVTVRGNGVIYQETANVDWTAGAWRGTWYK